MKTSTRKSCKQKAHRQRAKSLQLIALIGATFAIGALPPRLSPFLKAAHAFLPPSETVGPLTVEISGAAPVSQFGKAMALSATLSNSGTSAIRGTLRFMVADDWKISAAAEVPFALARAKRKACRLAWLSEAIRWRRFIRFTCAPRFAWLAHPRVLAKPSHRLANHALVATRRREICAVGACFFGRDWRVAVHRFAAASLISVREYSRTETARFLLQKARCFGL